MIERCKTQIVTSDDRLQSVPERWYRQYARDFDASPERKETWLKLLAMRDDGSLTHTAVRELISNASWTDLDCDLCGTTTDWLVICASDHDSYNSTNLCGACVDFLAYRIAERRWRQHDCTD